MRSVKLLFLCSQTVSSMPMYQRMRKPSPIRWQLWTWYIKLPSRRWTQIQVGIDSSCILLLCHARTCRRGCRAWTGCALKRRASAAPHGVSETAPCRTSSSALVCGHRRSWPVGSFSAIVNPDEGEWLYERRCHFREEWTRCNWRSWKETSSTDDGCMLFETQVWCECHNEEAWRIRSISNFGAENSPRSAVCESTDAVSSSCPQQFCFVRV